MLLFSFACLSYLAIVDGIGLVIERVDIKMSVSCSLLQQRLDFQVSKLVLRLLLVCVVAGSSFFNFRLRFGAISSHDTLIALVLCQGCPACTS